MKSILATLATFVYAVLSSGGFDFGLTSLQCLRSGSTRRLQY